MATKLILSENRPEDVLIVNAFIVEEHPDNRRFLADCEKWFGHEIVVLRDEKYGASTQEVWRRERYIAGFRGAPCSLKLKRGVLASVAQPGDVVVIGFTADEAERFESLKENFPNESASFRAPLIEKGLTKEDCLAIVDRAGIELPLMYRLGYQNANCIGCPKGGQNYWQAIRDDFPSDFVSIAQLQKQIGPGASFLRFRSGPRKGERMSLEELPSGRGNMAKEPSFSCGFVCELTASELATGQAPS